MTERDITAKEVENALINPDDIVMGKENRKIYQKKTGDKLLRVVTDGNRLLTVYITSKLKKYVKGGE